MAIGTATTSGLYRRRYSPRYGPCYEAPYDHDVTKRVLMGIQTLRIRLKERVDALGQGIHTVFTRHGQPVAVLVDMDWYRRAAEALGEPTEL